MKGICSKSYTKHPILAEKHLKVYIPFIVLLMNLGPLTLDLADSIYMSI